MDGVLRDTLFLSFLGLMVSLLGFRRTLPPPSARPVTERSPVLRADCGIELTVSVSTVMFRLAPSGCRDLAEESGVKAFFEGTVLGRGALVGVWLALRPRVSLLLPSLSLSPIRVCFSADSSPALSWVGVRSSSEERLCALDEEKLDQYVLARLLVVGNYTAATLSNVVSVAGTWHFIT